MTIFKIDQCTHCLRDDDECSAHPCSDVIEQRSAFEQPYYTANGDWQNRYHSDIHACLSAAL